MAFFCKTRLLSFHFLSRVLCTSPCDYKLRKQTADSRQQKRRFRSALRPCVLSDPSGIRWDQLKVDGAQQAAEVPGTMFKQTQGLGIHLPKHRHQLSVQLLWSTFLGILKALQKGSGVPWSLCAIPCSCLRQLTLSRGSLDNLLRMAVLEQRDWTGEFQKFLPT